MYAIIEFLGYQYRVEPETVIKVPKVDKKVGEDILIPNVLLFSDGKTMKVGKPFVEGARVRGVIVAHGREKKITVFKFKRRKGYRKKAGHRQDFTEIRVSAIETN